MRKKTSPVNPKTIPTQDIKIETVNNLEGLEPHAEAWNKLACRSTYRLPDQSHAWVASYLEHSLEADESWFCFFAYQHNQLIGVLPIVITPRKKMGLFSNTFRTPYNDQTASIDILASPGDQETIIPLFLGRLNHPPLSCFCFEMRRLPDCSPTLAIVGKGVKGLMAIETFDGYGSFIKIEGSFEEYCSRLGSKYTRNLRRLERKFFTLPGADLFFLTGKDLADEELIRFMDVEATSWKCNKGSALCQCETLGSFYGALTKRLKEQGWLEWHFLQAEGKTVAANLAIRVDRSLIILKTCYDESYASFSPGTVLFAKMFERAFSGGEVDEVNLLTDYSWNQNWQVEKRHYYNLFLYPTRPFPTLAGYLPLKTRKVARQWPGARPLYHSFQKWMKGAS